MVTIRLLGPPTILRDGEAVRPPRGRKAWALLSYVARAERATSRQHLAELLFGDADDPLGALRWTLAEIRRSLGRPDLLGGDPVELSGSDGLVIDVDLLDQELDDPAPLLDLTGELLEGLHLNTSPEFESWLLVERHRVSAAIEARLRQAAVAFLAAGQASAAVPYASRAVGCNPLEEGNHELLVRCLASAGDRAAAMRQVAVGEDILRRELGVTATAALREAAEVGAGTAHTLPLGGRASAVSQLEAGRAAILAGAVDAGVQCLRRAVAEADACKDTALQARALAALGSALVHAVRGRDEEGSLVLREALLAAQRAGERATAVAAQRELGFVEVQAGRRSTAEAWLAKALDSAETEAEFGAILGVQGMNASDRADYPAALARLNESVERAEAGRDPRQQAWSLSILARSHLLRGERSQAAHALNRSLDLVRDQRWLAFLPWPQALQAELALESGELDQAAEDLERAWSLSCQLGDPCWEGMAARGIARLHGERGDLDAAATWLGEAATRCNRVSDRYQWVHAYVLDAAVATAIAADQPERARALVAAMASLSARCELREMLVRAHIHRYRLGDSQALAAARLAAAEIDNPALANLVRTGVVLA